MTEDRITVWPEDEDEHVWIVSRDDTSSDTLAVFDAERDALFDAERDALAHGHEVAAAAGLRLYRWDGLAREYCACVISGPDQSTRYERQETSDAK